MPFYDFRRGDGKIVTRRFPISDIPDEITDEDGARAVRIFSSFNYKFRAGQEPPGALKSMSERRRRDNINAGDKGRGEWREVMPRTLNPK